MSWFSFFRRAPKDRAFSIYMEFGPKLLIDRTERLKQCFPERDEATIATWIAEFQRFDSLIWKVAEAGASAAHSSAEMADIFRKEFPDYSNASLRLATGRACYHAWHEGYSAPSDK